MTITLIAAKGHRSLFRRPQPWQATGEAHGEAQKRLTSESKVPLARVSPLVDFRNCCKTLKPSFGKIPG